MPAPKDFQTLLRPYTVALDYTDLAQKGGKNQKNSHKFTQKDQVVHNTYIK